MAFNGGHELPLRFRQYLGYLTERESKLTQPDDPVQPGHVVGVIEPVTSGKPRRGPQQPDLVVMVQRPDRQPGGLGQRADLPCPLRLPLISVPGHDPTLGPHATSGASSNAVLLSAIAAAHSPGDLCHATDLDHPRRLEPPDDNPATVSHAERPAQAPTPRKPPNRSG